MVEVAVETVPTLWHEVPDSAGADQFVAARTAGLSGEAREAAAEAAQYALAVRAETATLTLLLQEPQSSLYAVAVISLLDGDAPASESAAVELVCGADPGPWAPTVVPVTLGEHRGFRVSELVESDRAAEGEFHAIEFTQTTYVLSVSGRLVTAALSPAPATAAGVALALIEPLLATGQGGPRG